MSKICCINNSAPLYRKSIFHKMDEVLGCYFVFGDKPVAESVKIVNFDVSELKHLRMTLVNRVVFKAPAYWQPGVMSLLREDFDEHILLGDVYCLSTWLFALVARFMPKKRVYFWTHGVYGDEGKIAMAIKKFFFSLADSVFLYGNRAKKILENAGFDGRKLHVIYNSLDYETQCEILKNTSFSDIYSKHFGNDAPVIIYIGRIQERKKISMLLELVAQLRDKYSQPTNLVLVGTGNDMDSLSERAKKLDISDRVWFYGASYDDEKNCELILNATVSVTPGDIGLTAIHSMTFGCPVVTHNKFEIQGSEFEAITPNITGDFYEFGDIDDLCRKTLKWIGKVRENRDAVSTACRNEIAAHWNPGVQIEIIKNVLYENRK